MTVATNRGTIVQLYSRILVSLTVFYLVSGSLQWKLYWPTSSELRPSWNKDQYVLRTTTQTDCQCLMVSGIAVWTVQCVV